MPAIKKSLSGSGRQTPISNNRIITGRQPLQVRCNPQYPRTMDSGRNHFDLFHEYDEFDEHDIQMLQTRLGFIEKKSSELNRFLENKNSIITKNVKLSQYGKPSSNLTGLYRSLKIEDLIQLSKII